MIKEITLFVLAFSLAAVMFLAGLWVGCHTHYPSPCQSTSEDAPVSLDMNI